MSVLDRGRPRPRYLLVVLLAGAALFSMDVLRAASGSLSFSVIGLSFASALVKFALWGAAGALLWRLLERLPLDRRPGLRTLGAHVAASIAFPVVMAVVSNLLQARIRRGLLDVLPPRAMAQLIGSWTGVPGSTLGASLAMSLPWDLLTYWVLFAVIVFWQWAVRARERERRSHELAGELSRAHMHALDTQLRPHFLFNALNSVSGLIGRDPATAKMIARGLRGLFGRLLATERAPVHRLADELAFLRDYAAIQKARFGENLQLELDVGSDCGDALVPSLLLQPLVENAVRHGASRRTGQTRIRVAVRRVDRELHIEVLDDGPGCSSLRPCKSSGAGIGLRNTQERLQLLYGSQHRFLFEGRSPSWGGVRVAITIPLVPPRSPDVLSPARPDGTIAAEVAREGRPWLRAWALFLAAMAVLNLTWSAARFYVGAPPGGSFLAELLSGSRGAAAHVLLFPLIYAANRRLVAGISKFWARLVLHGCLALGLSLGKAALVRLFGLPFSGSFAAPSVVALMGVRIYSDLLHYALMAALCHALDRHRSLRREADRAARLEIELASRLKLLRSTVHPTDLLATLERIEHSIEPAPEEADRMVSSLGDRLRQMLGDSSATRAAIP